VDDAQIISYSTIIVLVGIITTFMGKARLWGGKEAVIV
jgi:hypothetical protein